jgi:TrmH family RNA methyltransferase
MARPESVTTSLIKRYQALATKKGRREARRFLVEGERAIRQIMASRPDAIAEIVVTDRQRSRYEEYPVRVATERQFEAMCLTKTPQGVLALVREPDGIYTDHLPISVGTHVLLLEDIQDPGNVGTLIRTAAAFNYSGVILSDQCADPLSPKSAQAASGTMLSVWIRRTGVYLQLVKDLRGQGYPVATADVHGEDDPLVVQDRTRLLLALGNEAAGPSPPLIALSDQRFRIAVRGERAESLNVAACGAIAMYVSSSLTAPRA